MPLLHESLRYRVNREGPTFLALRKEDGKITKYVGYSAVDFYLDFEERLELGDTVEVISGRLEDKGKRGEVINVLLEDRRVVVQGVNIRTKHQKQVQTSAGRNINPGRIQFEGAIDISNVMLVCPKCGEPTRVAVQRDEDGARRVCKNCQALID